MADRVLVTGISGFIAKHVALRLLNAGYEVVGTVRSLDKQGAVRETLARHGAPVGQLHFVEADLLSDAGWAEAASGCRYVQHLASPFQMQQPKDREGLVPAARDGALRVFNAGIDADAERIVVTSSMVAMMYRANRPPVVEVREDDWTDPLWRPVSPYIVSKTRAEHAVWDDALRRDARDRLVVVNPGFVLGPTLDDDFGTSLELIKLILDGTYPALPPVAYPVVDVRDLADVLISAMTAPDAVGRRLIATGDTLSLAEMAGILKEKIPERAGKIPTRTLPPFLVRAMALFDRSLVSALADLGGKPVADTRYVSEMTGVRFRDARHAVIAAGQSILAETA